MNQIKITWGQRKVSNSFVFLSILDRRRQLIKESPQDTATVRNNQVGFFFCLAFFFLKCLLAAFGQEKVGKN